VKPKRFTLFVLALSLLFIFSGCQASNEAGEIAPEATTPVEVTENFYNWYFDYIGEPDTEGMKNPLVDRAYRSSPHLTAAYITKVDMILTSFDQGGYDPFLQAQDFPQSFTVEEDYTAESDACVIVHEQWTGSPTRDLTIDLVREDGAWKINNIRPGNPRTPDGATRLFYNWYIDYAHNQGNPLVDEAYKASPYLSQEFIIRVEETLAGFGRGGYDPILLAQDIPVNFYVESPTIDGVQANVVVQRYWGGNPTPSPMTVYLEAVNGRWLIVNVLADTAIPEIANPAAVYCQEQDFTYQIRTNDDGSQSGVCILADGTECDDWAFFNGTCPSPISDATPTEVVQAFYDWYLAYIGDRSSGDFRNPLVDKAYHDNPLLTPDFITRVDGIVASFEGGGYDPFLLAQDIPEDLFAKSAMISGDEARVTVMRVWGAPAMDAIFAHLRQMNGIWLIDDITAIELYEPTTDTPEGTVQLFYAWYADALRRRFKDDAVDTDFHNSDLLTDSFKQHLDEMRAAAEAEFPEMGLGYDPLLCAQDVPYHVTPDQALIDGETAALTAHTSFMNHIITVDLQNTEAGWRISNVTCANTPEGAARAFYTWYLGYIGDRGDGNFHNPLAAKAYRGHLLLSDSLVQRVDAMFDAAGGIGYDPFLLAQEVPTNSSVDPGAVENTAVVHLQFGPNSARHLLLTFTNTYPLRIDRIEEATSLAYPAPIVVDISDWQFFNEETYGFAFYYPADWVRKELALDGPGMPDDWPVVRSFSLMPPDIAEQLAAQSGPPNPNAPTIVAPLLVEVVMGGEDAFNRVFVAPLSSEAAIFNGYSATIQWQDPGYAEYVLRHPSDTLLWIVITDSVTGFPGREAQAEALANVLLPLLNSLTFNETN
jgi:putative hemolysin